MTANAEPPIRTGYAPVHDLQMYFEIHGEPRADAPPLVLLHGGGDTIETSFGHVLPQLARTRQVIAFEQRGYGRTADASGLLFSFAGSADDAAALLAYLNVERADLLGFSNGGTIAAQVAIRHPQRVRKLILVSALFRRDGAPPEFWEFMKQATLEQMPQELQDAYLRLAPHPENLRRFHDQAAQRMRDFQDVPDEQLRGVAAPALVLIGDTDVIRPEHAVETYRLLPRARLGILPATDHARILHDAERVLPLIQEFLDAPQDDVADAMNFVRPPADAGDGGGRST